jgi:hypothetical protein
MRKTDKRTEENIKKLEKYLSNENSKFHAQTRGHILPNTDKHTGK